MKQANEFYPYYSIKRINTIEELLLNAYESHPNEVAFSYHENTSITKKTFEDFYFDVLKLRDFLSQKYQKKHIAIVGENSYAWILAFFAITLSGNICVAIDKDIDSEKLKLFMKKSDTKIIFYSKSYLPFVEDMKYESYELEEIQNLKMELKKKKKIMIEKENTAAIFFTSGTTGANKAVMLSHQNIAFDIYAACSLFELKGTAFSVLPYHHAFGLITSALMPFHYGKEVFICSSLKMVMKDFQIAKPDTIFVVPLFVETFYKQIWKSLRKKRKEKLFKRMIHLSNHLLKVGIDMRGKWFKKIHSEFGGSLRYMISGGAYLDPKYVKWFRSIGIEILNGYGITECSPVISVNRNHYHQDGSLGVPCKEVEVKIIDEEICIKGNIVMQGYYKDSKSTKEVLKDGYFYTGDLGYLDQNGFLYIKGRKKNIIILSNGENVSPEVIESELLKNDAIEEVIVYEKNDKLVASIYPKEEYLQDQEYFDMLIHRYNKDKPFYHQIAFVELRMQEFEKNSNKKIIRKQS